MCWNQLVCAVGILYVADRKCRNTCKSSWSAWPFFAYRLAHGNFLITRVCSILYILPYLKQQVSVKPVCVIAYISTTYLNFNPLNPELNPICYLLALLAHHFLHVSRIRVKSLSLRLLMSYIYIYIYGAPILDVSRSHTTAQHSR